LVANYAVADNLVDSAVQSMGLFFKEEQYPRVLGLDAAGVVQKVGNAVTRFKKGDRVVFAADFMQSNILSAYQEYSVAVEHTVMRIPDSMSFAAAATFPLAITTAGVALFDSLKLERPTPLRSAIKSHQTPFVIWGAGSSVGIYAVQLAVLAGYKVITTASKRHHEYLKSLGAAVTIDYHDADAVEQVKKAAGGFVKSAFAASPSTVEPAAEVVEEGGTVASAPVPPKISRNVNVVFPYGALHAKPEEAKWFYWDFLEKALEQGTIVPMKFEVLPGWIDGVQAMFDRHIEGVSGLKLVLVKPEQH